MIYLFIDDFIYLSVSGQCPLMITNQRTILWGKIVL